jgi:hypothetical protein
MIIEYLLSLLSQMSNLIECSLYIEFVCLFFFFFKVKCPTNSWLCALNPDESRNCGRFHVREDSSLFRASPTWVRWGGVDKICLYISPTFLIDIFNVTYLIYTI